tara:strand:+ start:5425 stop:6090 length:666 start_codon:yes stop_codon:yes gene_type:complete
MQKKSNIKLVLFDLDGTLIDTAPDFITSLNNVLSKYNKKNLTSNEIKTHISEGSSKLIKYAFNIKEDHQEFDKFKDEFLLEYKKNLTASSDLFDGIEEVLNYLDKNKIFYGVVTNKYHEYTDPIIESFPQLKNLKIVVCPDDVSVSKPHPEGILLACKKLGVSPENTVFLGDHQNDLKAGISAGASVIGCLYGYSLTETDKETYDCMFVDAPTEIILKINS